MKDVNDPRERDVMKRILLVDEKHETRYFDAGTDKALYASALKLLGQRVKDGFWYNNENQEIAERIVEAESGKKAWKFLHRRRDHDYEHVRLENLE